MIIDTIQRAAQDAWPRIAEPLHNIPGVPGNRWYFAYIGVTIVAALAIMAWRLGGLRKAAAYVFDPKVFLHRSATLDYRYAAVNHLFSALGLVYLIAAVNTLSAVFFHAFSGLTFLEGVGIEMGWMGFVLTVVIFAFAYDTANFFQHYLQHRIPILWEFHKVHHSAEVLTPVTVVRQHPVSLLVSTTCMAVCYGSVNGLAFNLFHGQVAQYGLIATNVFAFINYALALFHFNHSHIWLKYPRYIREVLASPCLHLIHHSNIPRHYDKNFAVFFTFWDRVFGSYYDPRDEEQHEVVYGIDASEGRDEYTSVMELYMTPFRRAWAYHLRPLFVRTAPPAE